MKNLLFTFFASFILFTTSYAQTTWTVDSLNDAGFGSLRAAADSAVTGDTIRFNPNLIASGSDSIVLTTGEIAFGNKGIIIKGLYTTTDTLFISGNHNSRIFSFNSGGTVILDSLVLINGNGVGGALGSYYSLNGGAIFRMNCWDTLFVINSAITGNSAIGTTSSGNGGAIYSHSTYQTSNLNSYVSVINSTISGNTASGSGGGVYSLSYYNKSAVNVSNSTISGNTATGLGGGIYSHSFNSSCSVHLSNSTLSGNIANRGGGGVSSSSQFHSCLVTVTSSSLLGNIGFGPGGGISSSSNSHYYSSSVIVTNSDILGNTSYVGVNGIYGNGGGIYSESRTSNSSSNISSVLVTNSTISGNTAIGSGGSIYSYSGSSYNNTGSSYSSYSSVIVANSTLSGNTASVNGGGVCSLSSSYASSNTSSSSVDISNSSITGNTALGDGGGISSDSYNSFSPNTSNPSNVTVTNSTISGNTASGNGGGVSSSSSSSPYSSSYSSVIIANSTLSGNTITNGNGSGISSLTSSSSLSTTSIITITSSIVAENGNNSSGVFNSDTTTIMSNGYNIFSDTINGSIASDFSNISTTQLNLQALAFNGGSTQTMLPGFGSVALDNGNPNDSSDAQNAPIIGTRNVGAAESCFALPSSISVSDCYTYTVPSGNSTYTQSGIYQDTLSSICGADSIIIINLTINSTQSIDVISDCNPITWIDGNTYSANNNTAMYTLVNAAGCDSIVTLDFTLLPATFGTDVISDCNPITWIDGNTYSVNNNTATHTLVNAVGCDSIITLDFTLLLATSGTDVITSCNSITWIDGITYNQTTNSPVFTIPNSQGCDSVVTLDFTLLEADTSVIRNYLTLTAQASNATYQWIDCDNGVMTGETSASFTATVNGNYQVEITQNGCVDTSACFAIMNVGVEGMEENESIRVYPNPTSSKLFIEAQNFKIVKIQILDNSGKVVKIITSNFDIVNVESLATGIYHMELIGDEKTVIKKFIKQ